MKTVIQNKITSLHMWKGHWTLKEMDRESSPDCVGSGQTSWGWVWTVNVELGKRTWAEETDERWHLQGDRTGDILVWGQVNKPEDGCCDGKMEKLECKISMEGKIKLHTGHKWILSSMNQALTKDNLAYFWQIEAGAWDFDKDKKKKF